LNSPFTDLKGDDMGLRDRYNLDNLRNRTADMVFRRIEDLIDEHTGMCTCENCILDLAAYTLNHVTPLYATSLLDPLQPSAEKEKKVRLEIDIALKTAVRRVKERPHHFTMKGQDR
jgi:competence protein ComFB